MEVLANAPAAVDLAFLRTVYVDADQSWLPTMAAATPTAPSAVEVPQSSDLAAAAAGAVRRALGGFFGKAQAAAATPAARAAEAAKTAAQRKLRDIQDRQ